MAWAMAAGAVPRARCAASGAKRSRPWKVRLTWGSQNSARSSGEGAHSRLRQRAGEKTVIRPDKEGARCLDQQCPPVAAYPRIHHGQVDSAHRKIGRRVVDHVGCLAHILGRNVVTEIHQLGGRGEGQNDPFHDANVPIGQTKIGGQGDNSHRCALRKDAYRLPQRWHSFYSTDQGASNSSPTSFPALPVMCYNWRMKTETVAPRLSVIDSLSAGLSQTIRRPWLMLIPLLVDLSLWLAPRLSLAPFLRNAVEAYRSLLLAAATPDQFATLQPVLESLQKWVQEISAHANLAEGLTGGWLGAPSVVAVGQITRMTFISDMVLAPLGLSVQLPDMATFPWHAAPVEISTVGGVVLAAAGFWLIGQVVTAVYMHLAGRAWRADAAAGGSDPSEQPRPSLLLLVLRLALFSLAIGLVMSVLLVPLFLGWLMVVVAGNSPLSFLAVIFSGMALWLMLWFFLALFFANEAIVLEGQPVIRSILRSLRLVQRRFAETLSLVALINLLLYGFRVVWDLIGVTPVGAAVAIAGNAFLTTGMLLATFAFFDALRQAAVVRQVKTAN